MCGAAQEGADFEDEEESEEGPLGISADGLEFVFSVGIRKRVTDLDGEVAEDLARQGLEGRAAQLVGTAVPNIEEEEEEVSRLRECDWSV